MNLPSLCFDIFNRTCLPNLFFCSIFALATVLSSVLIYNLPETVCYSSCNFSFFILFSFLSLLPGRHTFVYIWMHTGRIDLTAEPHYNRFFINRNFRSLVQKFRSRCKLSKYSWVQSCLGYGPKFKKPQFALQSQTCIWCFFSCVLCSWILICLSRWCSDSWSWHLSIIICCWACWRVLWEVAKFLLCYCIL